MKMGMTRRGTPAESCCTVNAVSKGASKKSTTVPVSVAGAVDAVGVVRNALFGALSLLIDTDLGASDESSVGGKSVGNSGGNSSDDVDAVNVTAAVLGETEVGNATVGVSNASVRAVKDTVEVGDATVGVCDDVKTCCSCSTCSVGFCTLSCNGSCEFCRCCRSCDCSI